METCPTATSSSTTPAQFQYIEALCTKAEVRMADAMKHASVAELPTTDSASKLTDTLKQLLEAVAEGGDEKGRHIRLPPT